ncbi:MAG: hypothetical protein A3K19_31290 [Lentisphaerae bacterium RIFOXYB12_FULL_65_16]|nr:MAG: hypothetical protein A3K18_22650 [Lentisphaerae bacterium RIFOXYA12_64_32]OGV87169.1 MAG: hypothetical protein A3K19_31290 [Lentisphaerae bacterium RIFOXYB12_FULL_65_16]
MQFLTETVIILAMLAFNALFAAYEMALASVSRSRLETLLQSKRRGAAAAVFMKDRLEAGLAVVQLGITLAGAIAAATGGVGVDEYLSPWMVRELAVSAAVADVLAIALFVIPLSALTIVFAELTPKMFALNNKEYVVLVGSPAIRVLYFATYPAIRGLEGCVKWVMKHSPARFAAARRDDGSLHELRAAAALARASRLISPLEEKIVTSAVQMSVRTVADAMLPPENIAMIPETLSLGDALLIAHVHMHTRYPLCREEGNPQTITGYVTFKDIVSALRINPGAPGVQAISRGVRRVPQTLSLSQALETMIREKLHMVLAEDDMGRVVGLLTLEDIMEQLVGDITDEYDRLPAHVQPLPSGWIVGGGVPMRKVFELAQGAAAADGIPASLVLDEWCRQRKGTPIQGTDVICADGIEVQVRKLRRQRVAEAVVRRVASDVPSAGGR